MPVSKKPKTKPTKSEAEVIELIDKGGSPALTATTKKDKRDIIPVSLRLPSELSRRIEAVLQKRAFKLPRHTWLLEAVIEKLEREEEK
ncbi:MAG: hypothetical protein RLZZ574_2260 [Cyanobacteriota bacterium]|jgi:hypothetical protein